MMKNKFILLIAPLLIIGSVAIAKADRADDEASKAKQELEQERENDKNCSQEKRAECDARRLEKGKKVVLASIERAIIRINKFRVKINDSEKLTSTEKATLLAKLDTIKSNLGADKAKVEAAKTRDELKTILKDVREQLSMLKEIKGGVAFDLKKDRLTNAADKLGSLVIKLQSKIDKLKAAGKDVTEFQTTLNSAKTNLEKANLDLISASTKESLKKVRGDLGDAHKVLKKLHGQLVSEEAKLPGNNKQSNGDNQ